MRRVKQLFFEKKEKCGQLLSGLYRWQERAGSKSINKFFQESGCSYEYFKHYAKWKNQRARIRAPKVLDAIG